jgi:hypothetical protein
MIREMGAALLNGLAGGADERNKYGLSIFGRARRI